MTDEREGGSTSPVEVSLKRDLGLVEVLMIGLGPNIGSTIFVLVGFGVQIAGPALLLSLILNFFVTLLTAVSYMELSSAFPETGGGYLWVREGLFPPLGFLGGWMSWIGHCIACAVYVLGFGEGVTWLMQQYGVSIVGIDPSILVKVFAVVIALVFTYMNYRGIKGAGRTQFYVSVILVGIIVIYLICALAAIFQNGIVTGAFDPFVPFGLMSIGSSMAFTFMIFEGYEIVAQTGEEAKDPERTVPKAMILCILISAVIFVVITAVTLAVSGWQEVAEGGTQAIAITAQKIVPVLGAALISIGTMIGSVAAINSVIFSTSRVSFAMGRDGTLPSVFGRLHAKNMTPYASIFFSAAIIIGISVTLPIEQVASVADILILILFVFVNAAAITLRKKRTDVKRRFITPFFPWIPVAGIITKMVLSITLFEVEPLAWYFAIAVIYAGLAMYYFSRGKKEIEEIEVPAREAPTVESLKRYRVLLPIDD
ncbi:MAG: amino acid permease, partial [Methanomassiliicoccales archaeon]|nr:amino acid permease [Methanomassiliicoccales archaeon]